MFSLFVQDAYVPYYCREFPATGARLPFFFKNLYAFPSPSCSFFFPQWFCEFLDCTPIFYSVWFSPVRGLFRKEDAAERFPVNRSVYLDQSVPYSHVARRLFSASRGCSVFRGGISYRRKTINGLRIGNFNPAASTIDQTRC